MSSWIFETYNDGNNFVEYRWDKGNTYALIVGHFYNDIVITDYHNTYATKESARRAFKRKVKQLCS